MFLKYLKSCVLHNFSSESDMAAVTQKNIQSSDRTKHFLNYKLRRYLDANSYLNDQFKKYRLRKSSQDTLLFQKFKGKGTIRTPQQVKATFRTWSPSWNPSHWINGMFLQWEYCHLAGNVFCDSQLFDVFIVLSLVLNTELSSISSSVTCDKQQKSWTFCDDNFWTISYIKHLIAAIHL